MAWLAGISLACSGDDGSNGDDTGRLFGNPQSLAATAIRDQRVNPSLDDFRTGHPLAPEMLMSVDTLALAFTLDTTVAEANAVLSDLEAEIIGGVPGAPEASLEGLLWVRIPSSTHEEMESTLDALEARPEVRVAVQRMQPGLTVVPRPNGAAPASWTWGAAPGDTWSMRRIRAPQLWNLNDAIRKRGDRRVFVGVYDRGFDPTHPDLFPDDVLIPSGSIDHGSHVAGTIGATFDNGVGVDGVAPFARMIWSQAGEWSGILDLVEERPRIRVLNASLGYNWYRSGRDMRAALIRAKADEDGLVFAIRWGLHRLRSEGPPPLLVAAAGNESRFIGGVAVAQEAAYASPYANAALRKSADGIIVVEAMFDVPIRDDVATADFSCINGHVSAPGGNSTPSVNVMSCGTTRPYLGLPGTSMATPHVSGLAAYLLSLDPDLDNDQLFELIVSNAATTVGHIDAFASAMDIDRLRGDTTIVEMLTDIDDGSADGNRRVELDGGREETDHDLDGDGGAGDGQVDMSDFRRFRDALLQAELGRADTKLDGRADHPKKDLNGDGRVQSRALENLFPRADFNGDGILSSTAMVEVAGAVGGQATDLDVLMVAFDDPDYSIDDLPDLLESGDVHVDAESCLDDDEVVRVESKVTDVGSEAAIEERVHDSEHPRRIYTLPARSEAYTVRVSAFDDEDMELQAFEQDVTVELGSDERYAPTCGGLVLQIQAPDTIDAGAVMPVAIRAGRPAAGGGEPRWEAGLRLMLSAVGGFVAHIEGETGADGRFETEIWLEPGSDEMTLTVEVDDGAGMSERRTELVPRTEKTCVLEEDDHCCPDETAAGLIDCCWETLAGDFSCGCVPVCPP